MPSDDEWQELLDAADPTDPVSADLFLKKLPGFSKSVLLSCDDGEDYAVKAQQARAGRYHRAIVADQVVGRLGQVMDAPVGQVGLVEVPQPLIEAEAEMQHCQPGLAHGCKWISGCSDKARDFRDSPENRERFAKMAMLYGLAEAHDHQVIYENQPLHRAHSVDHGHFLPPGAGRWTEESLRDRETFEADPRILRQLNFSAAELRDACESLQELTHEVIAGAVASVPSAWGITEGERIAMADYFDRGRGALLEEYGAENTDAEVGNDE